MRKVDDSQSTIGWEAARGLGFKNWRASQNDLKPAWILSFAIYVLQSTAISTIIYQSVIFFWHPAPSDCMWRTQRSYSAPTFTGTSTLNPIILIGFCVANPSNHQLERHIRKSASDSANVAFVKHAWSQMRAMHVNRAMVMEVLRMGRMYS